jgi:hypothetical protein
MNEAEKTRLLAQMNEGMMKIAETHKEMAEKCFGADAENMDAFTQCFKPINKVFLRLEEHIHIKMRFAQFTLDQCFQKGSENKEECVTSAFGNLEKIFIGTLEDLNKA